MTTSERINQLKVGDVVTCAKHFTPQTELPVFGADHERLSREWYRRNSHTETWLAQVVEVRRGERVWALPEDITSVDVVHEVRDSNSKPAELRRRAFRLWNVFTDWGNVSLQSDDGCAIRFEELKSYDERDQLLEVCRRGIERGLAGDVRELLWAVRQIWRHNGATDAQVERLSRDAVGQPPWRARSNGKPEGAAHSFNLDVRVEDFVGEPWTRWHRNDVITDLFRRGRMGCWGRVEVGDAIEAKPIAVKHAQLAPWTAATVLAVKDDRRFEVMVGAALCSIPFASKSWRWPIVLEPEPSSSPMPESVRLAALTTRSAS